ncbi:MAG: hypothetical protein ACKVT2_11460 [Saprospiraceae bacterium]
MHLPKIRNDDFYRRWAATQRNLSLGSCLLQSSPTSVENPENAFLQANNFDVFTEHFLRFISYQREMLGAEAFEKPFPF